MCTNNDGAWQLVGVTSWGGGICGKSTLPGVYTRVAKFDTWIKTVTSIRGISQLVHLLIYLLNLSEMCTD